MRSRLLGSLISDTHLPHLRSRTPLYFLLSSLLLLLPVSGEDDDMPLLCICERAQYVSRNAPS